MSRYLVALLLAAASLPAATPWHRDLFLALDDVWRARVPVQITNPGAADVAGVPVPVPIGAGQLPLAGARARDVRVCDDAGVELLFDLRSAEGVRLTDGAIPAGATLTVPGTAPAGGQQQLWVYWDHPATYRVPDYLRGGMGALNGSFEVGTGAAPDEWSFDGGDEERGLRWVSDVAHTGQRSLRCDVKAGAEPTWIAGRQSSLGVLPGRRYRLTAWIRGANVTGRVGWYVHVASPAGPQAVNLVQALTDPGTFDWRPLTAEFTAPADALSLSHGTVLNGTGTAWYDDVTIACLDAAAGGAEPTARVGQVERLDLAEVPGPRALPAWPGAVARTPVLVLNPGEALRNAVVQVPLAALVARLGRDRSSALHLVDGQGRPVPAYRIPQALYFVADLPARSRVEYALCAVTGRVAAPPELRYQDLLDSPANLARNASFEQGNEQPVDWPGTAENAAAAPATMQRLRDGRFGDWCVRTSVPLDAPLRWIGWRQAVAVEPNTSYLFCAWLRTQGVRDGQAMLHAHVKNAQGALTGSKYWSSSGGLAGDQPWTARSGVIASSADTATIDLHLTFNGRGTLDHDGVLFCRTLPAALGQTAQAGQVAPLTVWTVNPIVKVFRETPPTPGATALDLAAGRNEQEAAQLAVRLATAGQVSVTAGVLRNGQAVLPAPRVERVGYVPCLQPGGYFSSTATPWERRKVGGNGRTDGWRGWWPDYLAPVAGAVAVEADTTQPFWLTYSIPRAATPGVYRGEVRVSAGGRAVTVPVSLTVWKAVLPDRPTLQVIYDLRNGPGYPDVRTQADRERWLRFMAERRVAVDHVLPAPTFTLAEGKVVMDTAAFDRAAAFAFDELKMSAAYFPSQFYATGWAHPPRDFLGQKFPTAEYQAAYQDAIRQFWAHVKQRGWADRLSLYISDEPHYSRPEVVEHLGRVIDLVRAAAPDLPVYSSTWGHVPAWNGRLNHWGIAQYGGFPLEELAARRKAGDKVWFTTDGQMEIDTPYNACERLLPYYCFAHDVSGYEFWGISWFTYNPYEFGWHAFIHQSAAPGESSWVRYPNGDGYLAYPGEPLGLPGPLSTIRLEQAREGIEDYELLVALQRRAGEQPAATKLLDQVRALAFIPNAGGYRATDILPDPDALPALRRAVGDALDKLP